MSVEPSGFLYMVKDRITGQTGEIMHAVNDAAIIRVFDKMFTAGKGNYLIRDLELYRFAELAPCEFGSFPLIFNIDPVCICSGANYFEKNEGSDTD